MIWSTVEIVFGVVIGCFAVGLVVVGLTYAYSLLKVLVGYLRN